MNRSIKVIFSGLFFSVALANASHANSFTDGIEKAFEDDLVSLSLRYRYEGVDDDAQTRDATANTLKTSLTIAPKLNDWLFLAQVDDVRHINGTRFNDTRNGKGDRYPTVADPNGTDINQLFVRYNGFTDTELTVGRRQIVRANKRFIGGVEWRQNEQTFDTASAEYNTDKLDLFYAYVSNVERIFGPDSGTPPDNLDSDTHLFDGSYTFTPALKLGAYAYFMDFEDDAPGLSNQTLGLRATGKVGSADDINMDYQAEFATQKDHADNTVDYDADYYLLDATLNISKFGLRAGYEVLGGDRSAVNSDPAGKTGQAFQTPLATLHKFQGWADKFLATPTAGIQDSYLGATANFLGAKFSLYYHDFEAEEGSADYGSEVDASALWKIGKHYSVLLKAAKFDADSSSALTDSTKVWGQLQASW
jgi:hypothetical protein